MEIGDTLLSVVGEVPACDDAGLSFDISGNCPPVPAFSKPVVRKTSTITFHSCLRHSDCEWRRPYGHEKPDRSGVCDNRRVDAASCRQTLATACRVPKHSGDSTPCFGLPSQVGPIDQSKSPQLAHRQATARGPGEHTETCSALPPLHAPGTRQKQGPG